MITEDLESKSSTLTKLSVSQIFSSLYHSTTDPTTCNGFWSISNDFYSVELHHCSVLLEGLVHVVRDVGRILSFLVICRPLLDAESCKKILID